ncbi:MULTISPECIES: hypothetical protein [unclassified Campylobacter]|uniref:hypothetical protein n=1 Tax=unclassified Campylobacter TaxID=2593542 RepID=UPI001237A719|nr:MULTISPECIES: hypothetical protein [unclassified Campylobacter]KAA6226328.1 hypothetical protein FMM57_05985 [Campylobacter sp. LR286c]KAA6226820.1 hypothetical protein FMM55_04555 [Campylobacter sp. LR196d]KAA6230257.1 hypothetical protein FMM58_06185 [Campylobacter sp. LR291e]
MKKLLLICVFVLCAFGLERVSYKEILDFENARLKEAKDNKINDAKLSFIQATNKEESCKIAYRADEIYAKGFNFFWDGVCKDGFADGLGGLFIKDKRGSFVLQQIVQNYTNGKVEEYFICDFEHNLFKFIANSRASESYKLLKNDIVVEKTLIDDLAIYKRMETLLYGKITHSKDYSNFSYLVLDLTQTLNSTNTTKYIFTPVNYDFRKDGYVVLFQKNGKQNISFYKDDEKLKDIEVVKEYVDYANDIKNEIQTKLKGIESPLKVAKQRVEDYKKRICKNDIKVDFASDAEYKEICELNNNLNKSKKELSDRRKEIKEVLKE